MPFLRLIGHGARTWGVFPQGHGKCQSAVPYTPLTYPARERTPLLPCHLRQWALIRPSQDLNTYKRTLLLRRTAWTITLSCRTNQHILQLADKL